MTNEYTPTTEDIRRSYQCQDESCAAQDGQEFDRWLAAHDAEIRRDQTEKDADIAEDSDPGWEISRIDGLSVAEAIRTQFTPSPEGPSE